MQRFGEILLFCTIIMSVSLPLQADQREWTEPFTGIQFVWIEGGCFGMGQSESEKRQIHEEVNVYVYQTQFENELPLHKVCVDGFWMGKYEVTNAQYRRWQPDYRSIDFKEHTLDGDDQPVVYISWNDTRAFAEWLTAQYRKKQPLSHHNGKRPKFRLPTEAEWEYACRAGTTTARFWGDDVNSACNYANVADQALLEIWPERQTLPCHDGYAVTTVVGRFPPNAFGLFDMLGNVWEFCEDLYVRDIYRKRVAESPVNNPLLKTGGTSPVRRGGGWFRNASNVRCGSRGYELSACVNLHVGFRLVRIDQDNPS